MLNLFQEPYIQEIYDDRLEGVRLFVKREDLVHPYVSGNKWRKLKYNLEEARKQEHDTLLTFGGAFSNHIYATAAAAKEVGFKSIGIIRGDELKDKPLNSTLSFAVEHGMQLKFIDRKTYRNKTDEEFINHLKSTFGTFYLLPEGGTNELAIKGTAEIVNYEVKQFDYVCSSVGTGGTLAGIITGMEGQGYVLGFSALKGDFHMKEVQKLIGGETNWKINNEYHFGGYAKTTTELLTFISDFQDLHKIPLEPIYTGKMMFGLFNMIKRGVLKKGVRILAIHTGGLRASTK